MRKISKKLIGNNICLRNISIRMIFYGFFIWLVPALVATLLWDVSTNEPIIDMIWFNAIIGAIWSLNYALCSFLYFKNIKESYSKYGIIAGIIWYFTSFLLDFLVVILILNLGADAFLPGVIVYINNFILAVMIGYLLKKKCQNKQTLNM